jgi:hypothetical protein
MSWRISQGLAGGETRYLGGEELGEENLIKP